MGRRNYRSWLLSFLLAVGRDVSHFRHCSLGDGMPSPHQLHIGQHTHKSQTLLLGHTLVIAAHFRHTFGKGTRLLLVISYSAAASSALLILLL